MKYLIVGLGNVGKEYTNTRHNIGFMILDALAKASNISFHDKRFGYIGELIYKTHEINLLKPSTYMNNSGLAVQYWLKKKGIPVENMLVVADDIALPFGTIRIKPKGGNGGHNGLKSISEVLGQIEYNRLRFGIGNAFESGMQSDYVLGALTALEEKNFKMNTDRAVTGIFLFIEKGIQTAMNNCNG